YGNATITPSDITLYVQSSVNGVLSNNGVVVISAGQSRQTFTYMQPDTGSFTLTISASPTGVNTNLGSITQQGEVVYGEPAGFGFTRPSIQLERGAVSQQLTIELLNASGYTIPAP